MQDAINTWTKWWWLRLHQWGIWSSEERRASMVLWLTPLVSTLAVFFLFLGTTQTLHLGSPWNLAMPLAAAILVAVPGGRGLASEFFHTTVKAGDAAAARRLGEWVPDQIDRPLFPSLWWLDYRTLGRNWSPEEIATRRTIWGFTLILFLGETAVALTFLRDMNQQRVALGLLVGLALSLYASRRFCDWVWPDDFKRADALAYERLCRSGRNRSEESTNHEKSPDFSERVG
jgi:hypothetical protein